MATDGTLTADGVTTLPGGYDFARLAVDTRGRLYAELDTAGTATVATLRPNPDGTLTQEDSAAGAPFGGGFAVSPDGSEAVVFFSNPNNFTQGELYPFAVSSTGAVTAATPQRASGVAGNANNPQGVTFSPDSGTLWVTDQNEVAVGGGVTETGSFLVPFAVNRDGSLTAENPTPSLSDDPNAFVFDTAPAISPDGHTLYAPDDSAEPSSGTIDEFAIGAAGALTADVPASAPSDSFQRYIAIVQPPAATTTTTSSTSSGATQAPGQTVFVSPGPVPAPQRNLTGVAGFISSAANRAPIAGAIVSACPQGDTSGNGCSDATSDRSGHYAISLTPGTWVVQVQPPSAALVGAAVDTPVRGGEQMTENFALAAAAPIGSGVAFNTPYDGVVTKGVPTLNWDQAFSFTIPISLPGREAPDTTILTSRVVGISAASAKDAGSHVAEAGVLLFGVRYGADGTPTGLTDPFVAQISCADRACDPFAAGGGGPRGGTPGLAFVQGSGGGVTMISDAPDGQQVTLPLSQLTEVPFQSGSNPFGDVAVQVGTPATTRGADDAYGALLSELEGLRGGENASVLSCHTDCSGGEAAGSVTVNVPSLNSSLHGAGVFFDAGNDGAVVAPSAAPRDASAAAASQGGALAQAGVTVFPPNVPSTYPPASMANVDNQVTRGLTVATGEGSPDHLSSMQTGQAVQATNADINQVPLGASPGSANPGPTPAQAVSGYDSSLGGWGPPGWQAPDGSSWPANASAVQRQMFKATSR